LAQTASAFPERRQTRQSLAGRTQPIRTQPGSRSGLRPVLLLLNTLGLMALVILAGDALLFDGRPGFIPAHLWAAIDSPIHGVLAVLAVSPIFFWREPHTGKTAPIGRLFSRLASAGVAAVFIDLDHFVAARSFSLFDATHLNGRPATHGLLFALLCGLLAWALTRQAADGWVIFGALLSHLLRDAGTGGAPLFWPYDLYFRLSQPAYFTAQVSLCLALWVAGVPSKASRTHARR
jgi:hypothetical protein